MLKQKINNAIERSKEWVDDHWTGLIVAAFGVGCFGYGLLLTSAYYRSKGAAFDIGFDIIRRDGFLTLTRPDKGGSIVKMDDEKEWMELLVNHYDVNK